MARPRLSIGDYLHRGIVYSLAGLSLYAVVMSVLVHRDTIKRGQEIMAERKALGLSMDKPNKENTKEVEQSLAEQAQAIFRKRNTS
jgi:hypothetical protein